MTRAGSRPVGEWGVDQATHTRVLAAIQDWQRTLETAGRRLEGPHEGRELGV